MTRDALTVSALLALGAAFVVACAQGNVVDALFAAGVAIHYFRDFYDR